MTTDNQLPVRTETGRATPRPWRAKGGPQEGVDYIVGPGKDDFLTGPIRRANAALIVEAINAYDRLRAIEAAAREFADANFGSTAALEARDRLRAALEGPSA